LCVAVGVHGAAVGLGLWGWGLWFRLWFRLGVNWAGLCRGCQRHLERVQELLRNGGLQSERCHQPYDQLMPACIDCGGPNPQ